MFNGINGLLISLAPLAASSEHTRQVLPEHGSAKLAGSRLLERMRLGARVTHLSRTVRARRTVLPKTLALSSRMLGVELGRTGVEGIENRRAAITRRARDANVPLSKHELLKTIGHC